MDRGRFTRLTGPVFAGTSADGGTCAGFVRTAMGALVIDAFLTREDGRALLEAAQAEARRVTAVVYTHEHFDHTAGTTDFPPCGVIASEGTARGLARQLERWREELARQELAPRRPTLVFDSRVRLPWDPEVVIVELGGHAEGSSVVFVPEHRVLFTGDLVFRGRPPYVGTIRPEKWVTALRTLEEWDVETVVPGHGPVGGREVLTEQRVWLEGFLERVREVRERGTPLDEAVDLLAAEFGYAEERRRGLRMALETRLGFGGDGVGR